MLVLSLWAGYVQFPPYFIDQIPCSNPQIRCGPGSNLGVYLVSKPIFQVYTTSEYKAATSYTLPRGPSNDVASLGTLACANACPLL